MFMVGANSDSVYQYSLTTGFDLSTASYDSVSFSVSAQDTNPYGIAFNSDGTKMFIVGNTNDSVYQYSLTTGFDLSTASYDSVSFSVSAQDATPSDIAFNSDGTKMFMVGITNGSVYQYSTSRFPIYPELADTLHEAVILNTSNENITPIYYKTKINYTANTQYEILTPGVDYKVKLLTDKAQIISKVDGNIKGRLT
jgi:hypothetical protein